MVCKKKFADGGSTDPWADMYAKPAAQPAAKPAAAAAPISVTLEAPKAPEAKAETATQELARKYPVGGAPVSEPSPGVHSVGTVDPGIVNVKSGGSPAYSPDQPISAGSLDRTKTMPSAIGAYADGGMVGMMDRHNNDNRLPKHAHHKGRGHG